MWAHFGTVRNRSVEQGFLLLLTITATKPSRAVAKHRA